MLKFYTNLSKISVLLVLVLFNYTAHAQRQQIDLYKERARTNGRNPDSLKYYGNQLLQLKDSSSKTEGYFFKGLAWQQLRKPDSMLFYFKQAELLMPSDNEELKGRVLQGLSTSYLMKHQPAKVLHYSILQENLARTLKNNRMLSSSLSRKGGAQVELGDYEAGIKSLIESAKIEEGLVPNQLPSTYQKIGSVYRQMNRPEMAAQWYHKSLKAAKNHAIPVFKYGALQNLAAHHEREKRLDSSKFYASQIIELPNQDPSRNVSTFLMLSRIALHENNIPEAEANLQKAKSIELKGDFLGLKRGIPFVAQKILRRKGDYKGAEKILDSLASISDRDARVLTFPLLLEMAEFYQEQERYKEAFQAFSAYTKIKDSLISNNDMGLIQRSADEYDIENKEKAIRAALDKNENSQQTIVILVASGLFITIILFFVYRGYRKSKLHAAGLEKKNLDITASFEKLKNQIAQNKPQESPSSILINSKQIVKFDQLEYVKSEGHYLDYFVINEQLPITERSALKDRITELETSGFLQVHRSFIINIDKVRSIRSGVVVMETGTQIPLSRTYKQRLREEKHPLFA